MVPTTVRFLPLNCKLPSAFVSVIPLRKVAPLEIVVVLFVSTPLPLSVAPFATVSAPVPNIPSASLLFSKAVEPQRTVAERAVEVEHTSPHVGLASIGHVGFRQRQDAVALLHHAGVASQSTASD